MPKYLRFAIALAMLLGSVHAWGWTVFVDSSPKDNVGKLLIYDLKELIRKSGNLRLAETEETPHEYTLRILTLDPDKNSKDEYSQTVYSVILLEKFLYITSSVGICGSLRTSNCAKRILMGFDTELHSAPILKNKVIP